MSRANCGCAAIKLRTDTWKEPERDSGAFVPTPAEDPRQRSGTDGRSGQQA